MGKIIFGIKNLFYNLMGLLKSFCSERIYWQGYVLRKKNCTVHKKTFIDRPYSLKNVSIGLGTNIGPNSKISQTIIGKFCSIGPNFLCGWGIHPLDGISTNPLFYSSRKHYGFTFSQTNKITERKNIIIGNDVFIGANVTVLDGCTIGDGAVIGAGAVVSKNIPPYAIAVGCPIKIIRYRFDTETIDKLLKIRWWDKDETGLKKVEKYFWDINSYIKSEY